MRVALTRYARVTFWLNNDRAIDIFLRSIRKAISIAIGVRIPIKYIIELLEKKIFLDIKMQNDT